MGFQIGETAKPKIKRDTDKELKYVDDWMWQRE